VRPVRARRAVRHRALPAAALVVMGAALVGCGSSSPSPAAQAQQQAFLNDVHETAADVNNYRTDTELVRLGHAVCDDLRSGASEGTIADRLATTSGASQLPSEDLGAVITSAAQVFCPAYASKVS
jgi:hypothetical protein